MALAAASLFVGASLATSAPKKLSTPDAVPAELIVGFKHGVSAQAQDGILRAANAQATRHFGPINAALVSVDAADLGHAKKQLHADPRVRYVEPNYIVHADGPLAVGKYGKLIGSATFVVA
jgi:hypothetical protein